jgi:hypothetical protein
MAGLSPFGLVRVALNQVGLSAGTQIRGNWTVSVGALYFTCPFSAERRYMAAVRAVRAGREAAGPASAAKARWQTPSRVPSDERCAVCLP